MRNILLAFAFMLAASSCYKPHNELGSPCLSERYRTLGAQTAFTTIERAEYDSLELLCQQYIFDHRDANGNKPKDVATEIVSALALGFFALVAVFLFAH
jgi:hypothetical protein